MKHYFQISIFILIASQVFGQAPKFSNDFLNIGVGSRGMAMAGAVTASTDHINAAYWNPAGLVNISANFQVGAQHAEWYSGIGNYDYIGFGKKLDAEGRSFGAISAIRMGIDNIPNTLRLIGPDGSVDYSRIQSFSVVDYGFLVSYGRKLKNEAWNVGLNAKIIHRSFGSFAKAWGVGFDVGVLYHKNKIRFSIVGKDITSTYNAYKFTFSDEEKAVLQATDNTIPVSSVEYTLPKLNFGFNYTFTLSPKIGLSTELDLDCSTNGTKASLIGSDKFNAEPKIGIELDYSKKIFLRLGSNNFQSELLNDGTGKEQFTFQPTGGLGLRIGKIGIDYALTNIGNVGVGLYSHFFSVSLDF